MKPGRKTILTKELEERICKNIEVCYYTSTACEAVGVSYGAVRAWIDKGLKHQKAFHPEEDECTELCNESDVANRRFMRSVKAAQATFSLNNMQDIAKHKPKNWMAGAWLQERTQPDKYALQTVTRHSHSGQINHKHTLSIEARQKILLAGQKSLMIDTQKDDDVIEVEIVPSEG